MLTREIVVVVVVVVVVVISVVVVVVVVIAVVVVVVVVVIAVVGLDDVVVAVVVVVIIVVVIVIKPKIFNNIPNTFLLKKYLYQKVQMFTVLQCLLLLWKSSKIQKWKLLGNVCVCWGGGGVGVGMVVVWNSSHYGSFEMSYSTILRFSNLNEYNFHL